MPRLSTTERTRHAHPYPALSAMTNTRIFWVAWCCMWALGWLLLGFFTIITWLFVPFSLLAILIPIGKPSETNINITHTTVTPPPQDPNNPYGHHAFPTPPAGNTLKVDGPAYDEAYQRWLRGESS